VHADLSAFNLLWWEEKLWLIDFPQAIDVTTNPHAFEYLHRDLTNIGGRFAPMASPSPSTSCSTSWWRSRAPTDGGTLDSRAGEQH
jgi:serine/threonine-protein kinase RIO1